VYVAGTIKGTIDASEKVLVLAGGVVHGDVRAPSFGLAAGGRVEGRVSTPNPERGAPRARKRKRKR
jgi:cytoskeletal protein CcmA (bactofilin family)